MANPFPYQRPVLPAQVIDRDAETGTLLDWCRDGMLVRLDAPRRYGKTSLVRRVFHEAAKGGTVGILCDLKGVLTLSDVITRLGRSYAQLQGSAAKLLRPTLTAIEAEFSVSFMGAGVKSSLAGRPANEEAALFALLDLPQRFAGKGWNDVIVCFDEFQDVLAVPAADDKLRAAIQHHDAGAAYIFAGSEPRLMNALFGDKHRAFWGQAEPLELTPLAAEDVARYIADRFEVTWGLYKRPDGSVYPVQMSALLSPCGSAPFYQGTLGTDTLIATMHPHPFHWGDTYPATNCPASMAGEKYQDMFKGFQFNGRASGHDWNTSKEWGVPGYVMDFDGIYKYEGKDANVLPLGGADTYIAFKGPEHYQSWQRSDPSRGCTLP